MSIVDLTVGLVVLVAVLLPARQMLAGPVYKKPTPANVRDLARYQARLAADPGDGNAADELTRVLLDLRQTDWAIRVAGEASSHRDSATSWRSLLAVSMAHADRVEVAAAHAFARQALEACRLTKEACPSYQEVRLALYERELKAGIDSGIDPRIDPLGFQRASRAGLRTVRLRGANAVDPEPAPVPTLDPTVTPPASPPASPPTSPPASPPERVPGGPTTP